MKFGELLTQYRQRSHLKKTDLARLLKVSLTYIINLENGMRKPPPFERCRRLIEVLKLSSQETEEFLRTTAQERMPKELTPFCNWQSPKTLGVKEKVTSYDKVQDLKILHDFVTIPLLAHCPTHSQKISDENALGWIALPKEMVRGQRMFLLKVNDDSMNKAAIEPGDTVLINRDAQLKNGDIVVANIQEKPIFRRLYRFDDQVTLSPDSTNLEYKPLFFDKKSQPLLLGAIEVIYLKRVR